MNVVMKMTSTVSILHTMAARKENKANYKRDEVDNARENSPKSPLNVANSISAANDSLQSLLLRKTNVRLEKMRRNFITKRFHPF